MSSIAFDYFTIYSIQVLLTAIVDKSDGGAGGRGSVAMANQLGTSRLRFTTENGNAYSSRCKDSYSKQDAQYYSCHSRFFAKNTNTISRKPTKPRTRGWRARGKNVIISNMEWEVLESA